MHVFNEAQCLFLIVDFPRKEKRGLKVPFQRDWYVPGYELASPSGAGGKPDSELELSNC